MVKVTIEKDGKLCREAEGEVMYLIMREESEGIKIGAIGEASVEDMGAVMSIGIAGIIGELDLEPIGKRAIAKAIEKFVPEIVEEGLREERVENVQ